jgi:hypothetical protein
VSSLSDLHAQYARANVEVIAIARVAPGEKTWSLPPDAPGVGTAVKTGDTPEALSHFLRATQPAYPVAVDRDGITMGRYHVKPRPTRWELGADNAIYWGRHTLRGDHGEACYLIDPQGTILWMGSGGEQELRDLLLSKLREDRRKREP